MKFYGKEIKFIFSLIILFSIFLSCSNNPSSSEFWVQTFIILFVFGLITGAIANSKGHSFFSWFIFGVALFIVALPMALLLKKTADNTTTKKCPQCAEVIQKEALVCRYCHYKFTDDVNEPKINDNLVIENNYYCQKCGEELFLDEEEVKNKKFTCPKCSFKQVIP